MTHAAAAPGQMVWPEARRDTMRRMLGLGVALALAMSLVISGNTASASSTTRWVNYTDPNGGLYVMPGTSCNDPGYQTIQSAVIASISGDRINVCPGTYQEQVTIGAGKNNVQLRSTSVWQAVIQAPLVQTNLTSATIVHVSVSTNVTILAFTITGPRPPAWVPAQDFFGVRVDSNGSANI